MICFFGGRKVYKHTRDISKLKHYALFWGHPSPQPPVATPLDPPLIKQ